MISSGESVLITGGTGLIGRALAAFLDAAGADLTFFRRTGKSSSINLPGRQIWVDCISPNTIRSELKGAEFDRVFNLAGYGVNPRDREVAQMMRVNVDCPAALVENVRAKRSFIHVGSCSEYAPSNNCGQMSEDSPLESFKIYGASKAAGSLTATAIARSNGQSFVVARLFNVFGAGEADHRLFPSLLGHLRSGTRVSLSPGTQVRDFLSITDIIDALIGIGTAIEGSRNQTIVNLCSGRAISVRTFAETLCEVIGADSSLLAFGDLPFRPDDAPSIVGDPSALFSLTKWRPRFSLRERLIEATARAGVRVYHE